VGVFHRCLPDQEVDCLVGLMTELCSDSRYLGLISTDIGNYSIIALLIHACVCTDAAAILVSIGS